MKLSEFLWDRRWYFLLMFVASGTTEILLYSYDLPGKIYLYAGLVPVLCYITGMAMEYRKKKKWFLEVGKQLETAEDFASFLAGVTKPDFLEGEYVRNLLEESEQLAASEIEDCRTAREEYKDYIELWIHEIKTPIAAAKLILDNHPDLYTKRLEQELDRIDTYTEEALYFARSTSPEKDYLIQNVNLDETVKEAILKNKRLLISNRVSLSIHDTNFEVLTDKKWILFMLGQVLQNSVKYMQNENKCIEIWGVKIRDRVILSVKDSGIGIRKSNLPQIFEKGFTGQNGRLSGSKATGIGLYLCSMLCEKLGVGLEAKSEEGKWTCIEFQFVTKM